MCEDSKADQPDEPEGDQAGLQGLYSRFLKQLEGIEIEPRGSIGQVFASYWFEALKKKPLVTFVATVIVVGGLITGFSISEKRQRELREQERAEDLTLHNQLEKLEKTEESLGELLVFVRDQRSRLRQSEQIVDDLQSEKAALEPVVQANRSTVDAIFALQEKRRSASVWKERGIGFGFGVLASLLATAIWAIGAAFYRRKPDLKSA